MEGVIYKTQDTSNDRYQPNSTAGTLALRAANAVYGPPSTKSDLVHKTSSKCSAQLGLCPRECYITTTSMYKVHIIHRECKETNIPGSLNENILEYIKVSHSTAHAVKCDRCFRYSSVNYLLTCLTDIALR